MTKRAFRLKALNARALRRCFMLTFSLLVKLENYVQHLQKIKKGGGKAVGCGVRGVLCGAQCMGCRVQGVVVVEVRGVNINIP